MKKHIYLFIALLPTLAFSQTFTDGLMMPKGSLCTGVIYTHDQWKKYWEGELNRENGNMGTVTTQTVMWIGTYGITNKINALVTVPYVMTKQSGGTIRGMEGFQDLTIGVKYNFFSHEFGESKFKAFGALSFATPLTDYTPDLLPVSIGMASKKLTWRLGTYYRLQQGWFGNVSAGYIWRSNVTLDRPAHYYDGQNVNSVDNEAYLPNMFDLFVSAGYIKGALQAELNFMQMNTLGGDDIGRQGPPEVGNRMNSSKIGATVMYYVPKPKGLAVRGAFAYTVAGRNVGQSTTLTAGLLYTIRFIKNTETTPGQ